MAPVISAALYVIVFGRFIGDRIGEVGGLTYVEFLIPGLIMMNIITSAYGGAAFSIFFAKWEKVINDILTSPLSYLQMVAAIILGSGVIRAFFIGGAVALIMALFGTVGITYPLITLYFTIATAVFFASLGMIVGLWAERFDHFNVIQTFLITPLIYLGGVFYSIDTLPEPLQAASQWNPMLYMVNGLRYGMIGVSDTDLGINMIVVGVLAVVLLAACVLLFRSGYKLRV